MSELPPVPVTMKLVAAPPPNMAAIDAKFNVVGKHGVVFCYGDTIYNPSGVYLPPEIVKHESVHSMRQLLLGPVLWWEQYIADEDFRFKEELPAHIAEYAHIEEMTRNKRLRKDYLVGIVNRLSGPLYGNIVNRHEAEQLIREGASILREYGMGLPEDLK